MDETLAATLTAVVVPVVLLALSQGSVQAAAVPGELRHSRGQRIDVMVLLRSTSVREKVYQVRAFIHGDDERVAGRLCWVRLPQDRAEQARVRAKPEADGPVDKETLEAAEYVEMFTSVLHGLKAEQLLDLYRARWQIELEFKRAKSIRDLVRLPNFRPDTIHCWICAKLLLQTIATRIAAPTVAFPPGAVPPNFLPPIPITRPSPAGQRGRASQARSIGRHLFGACSRLRHPVQRGGAEVRRPLGDLPSSF